MNMQIKFEIFHFLYIYPCCLNIKLLSNLDILYKNRVASATVAAAVTNDPKVGDDMNLSRNMSNPNLLVDGSFQGNIQHSVQIRPSAPPLPHNIHHHHHVLYKACSAGYMSNNE